MKVIIDLDKISDPEKEALLLKSLKLMEIDFQLNEKTQSIEDYNADLEGGDREIEQGQFIMGENLKIEARKW